MEQLAFGDRIQTNVVDANAGDLLTNDSTPHVPGPWVTLLTPDDPGFGFSIRISSNGTPGTNTSTMLDIALSGGEADPILSEFLCGYAAGRARSWAFPLDCPDGVAIRARTRGAVPGNTTRLGIWVWEGEPPYPGLWNSPRAIPIGTNPSISRGTTLTPGFNAMSDWVDLGVAADPYPGFVVSWQGNGRTVFGARLHHKLDLGQDDSVMFPGLYSEQDGSEVFMGPYPTLHPLHYVAGQDGAMIQARASCESVAPAQTIDVAAYGLEAA